MVLLFFNKLNYFINNFIKKEEIFLGGEERGIFALGCAMGGRERCLFVANESVWRGEVFEKYWWGEERGIFARGCAMGGRES